MHNPNTTVVAGAKSKHELLGDDYKSTLDFPDEETLEYTETCDQLAQLLENADKDIKAVFADKDEHSDFMKRLVESAKNKFKKG